MTVLAGLIAGVEGRETRARRGERITTVGGVEGVEQHELSGGRGTSVGSLRHSLSLSAAWISSVARIARHTLVSVSGRHGATTEGGTAATSGAPAPAARIGRPAERSPALQCAKWQRWVSQRQAGSGSRTRQRARLHGCRLAWSSAVRSHPAYPEEAAAATVTSVVVVGGSVVSAPCAKAA